MQSEEGCVIDDDCRGGQGGTKGSGGEDTSYRNAEDGHPGLAAPGGLACGEFSTGAGAGTSSIIMRTNQSCTANISQ